MVSLVGFEGQLFLRLDALALELLDLLREDGLGGGGAVDTVGLDGDDNTTADLEEHVGVEGDDAGLVGLSNVGEDAVDHGHKHAVPQRVARVVDDRDYVRPVLRHVHQVPAAAVAELNRVHVAGWTNYVGDVGD